MQVQILNQKQEGWPRMDFFVKMGAVYTPSTLYKNESRIPSFLANIRLPLFCLLAFLVGSLYWCAPPAYVCTYRGRYTPAVYRSICTYNKKTNMPANTTSSSLPESMYSSIGGRHNKQQQTWPRHNFLLENAGAFPTNNSSNTTPKSQIFFC